MPPPAPYRLAGATTTVRLPSAAAARSRFITGGRQATIGGGSAGVASLIASPEPWIHVPSV